MKNYTFVDGKDCLEEWHNNKPTIKISKEELSELIGVLKSSLEGRLGWKLEVAKVLKKWEN